MTPSFQVGDQVLWRGARGKVEVVQRDRVVLMLDADQRVVITNAEELAGHQRVTVRADG